MRCLHVARHVALLFVAPCWLLGQTSAAQETNPEVVEWIRVLHSTTALEYEYNLAIDRLAEIGEPAIPEMLRALAGENELTQLRVLEIFARMRENAAPVTDRLRALLEHPNKNIRAAAARDLACIGPPAASALSALIASLDDRDEITRSWAARAIEVIDPSFLPDSVANVMQHFGINLAQVDRTTIKRFLEHVTTQTEDERIQRDLCRLATIVHFNHREREYVWYLLEQNPRVKSPST